MQIPTRDIREGGHVGEHVWICHYNRPDLDKKPLRNIPPTKVLVRSNEELPSNKRVYYSQNHFVKLNKKGKPTSQILSPVDNTGYRCRSGNELFVFDCEKDCNKEWNKQLNDHINLLNEKIETAADYWKAEKQKLLDTIA